LTGAPQPRPRAAETTRPALCRCGFGRGASCTPGGAPAKGAAGAGGLPVRPTTNGPAPAAAPTPAGFGGRPGVCADGCGPLSGASCGGRGLTAVQGELGRAARAQKLLTSRSCRSAAWRLHVAFPPRCPLPAGCATGPAVGFCRVHVSTRLIPRSLPPPARADQVDRVAGRVHRSGAGAGRAVGGAALRGLLPRLPRPEDV
jgi:hypothetical protein